MLQSLAAAFESSSEAVLIQRDGRVLFANQKMLGLFGFTSLDEVYGRPLVDMIATESRAQAIEYMDRRRRGLPVPSPFVVVGERADRSTFQLEVRGASIFCDGAIHGLSFVRDVTEQHRVESARRDRETMYKALFEVNAAIKLLIDPSDGRIVDANPAAAQFYGWSLDELRRMRISDINTLSHDEVRAEMERARSRRRTSFEFKHRRRNGAIADVEVHSGPLEVDGRTLLLSIIHDVTERNRFEEQLRHAQRLEAIGRLAAGIAHDFNNLLTVISASVQLAERKPTPERVARCLADVREATQRGADLTRHLFALGRDQTLSPSPVDLGRMLGNLASLLQRVLGDTITVTTDVAARLPRVEVDPGQLEMMLINMALNARDAMPDGGHLVLGAGVPAAVPPGFEGADLLAITVTDDGLGMDEATRARAFEPFFTTKPVGLGSGLGLAVAFGIAAQSGGTITVDSKPGEGTRFTVYLPVARAEEQAAPPRARNEMTLACTVLLVEDQTEVREALGWLMQELGATVHAAASAPAALALLDELGGPPDVVVSDVAMPGGSGVELAATLAARWPELPVVLMSGHADPIANGEGRAFLRKPFSIDELTEVLRQVAPACVRGGAGAD